jgi:ATP-dependent Clp protease ATP-binding subunit ClpB
MIKNLESRLKTKQLSIDVSKRAKEFIVDQGFDSIYGARPLKRYIQSHVETLIARMILSEDIEPGTTLNVDYDGSELVIG